MKKYLPLLLLLPLICLGCRRIDIREMTVKIPGLTKDNQPQVMEALSKYSGIIKESYKWDFENRTLTLKYDSINIAQSNIRYAIDEKGIKVEFPAKTDDHAGH